MLQYLKGRLRLMIIVSVISLVFSLLLQGLMSNFFGYSISNLSIFSTVYVLITLVVLQQYFESDKKFLVLIIVFGMLMDIVYSNTFVLCACIFVLIFYLNKFFSNFFPYNVLMVNGFSLVSVFIYHVVNFFFLMILRFDNYGVMTLLKVIGCNIIMTIIYTTIMYYLISFIVNKFDLKVVRDK